MITSSNNKTLHFQGHCIIIYIANWLSEAEHNCTYIKLIYENIIERAIIFICCISVDHRFVSSSWQKINITARIRLIDRIMWKTLIISDEWWMREEEIFVESWELRIELQSDFFFWIVLGMKYDVTGSDQAVGREESSLSNLSISVHFTTSHTNLLHLHFK